ncbi:MAG: PIG-L family deacetylase [Acidobacteriota bacterium]
MRLIVRPTPGSRSTASTLSLFLVSYLAIVSCLASGAILPSPAHALGASATDSAALVAPPIDLDALEPASTGGLAAVDRALARLATHRRLLVIAAHPDDEDTSLLTFVARGLGGEAAYLSLTRGDGGQNLIGAESGEALGLLRSRELEAARRIDGARQFFARAYDFGFTRSLDETFTRWPRDVLLDDAMRVVRRFQPQVIVSIFPPTAAAGHGQHQASAVVAEEVFRLSRAEDDAFPELTAEGLQPWRVDSFARAGWFAPDEARIETDLGLVEPFSGRSMLQLALDSRSQHRCQDMGRVQTPGDANGRYIPVAGVLAELGDEARDLFAGVDTSLPAIADSLADGALRQQVALELDRVAREARAARDALSAVDRATAVGPLAEIVRRLDALVGRLDAASQDTAGRAQVRRLLAEKLFVAREGLAAAAGLVADAFTVVNDITPGATLEVRTLVWSSDDLPLEDLEIEPVGDWALLSSTPADAEASRFATRLDDERILVVEAPAESGTLPGVPYHLAQPRRGDLFDWRGVPQAVRGLPFAPPSLQMRFRFHLADAPMELVREVVQRVGDQARGEVREPLRRVPPLEIALDRKLAVWPLGSATPGEHAETLTARLLSHVDQPLEVVVTSETPDGWRPIPPQTVTLAPRSRASVTLRLEPTSALTPGPARVAVRATARAAASDTTDEAAAGSAASLEATQLEATPLETTLLETTAALDRIAYEHIRPTVTPRPALVDLSVVDLRLPTLERIGWVRGAADELPELLRAVGLPIEVLDAATLEAASADDLSRYDALVVGSRAYEVEPALAVAHDALLGYARGGGLLLVLYQQYQFVRGGYPPYPLAISRPHDRVTDETAPVVALRPSHPALTTPHRIGPADWQGWVQERGLYFAGTWDDAYTPLLGLADPGGDELRGSLLVAPLGDGTYVYTGLSFFRQLPAGVPGAYRLFTNLLALATPEAGR